MIVTCHQDHPPHNRGPKQACCVTVSLPWCLCRVVSCGAGIFVSDILDAVPIDKYFELFKPSAGGEGGFIRLGLDFTTDPNALPRLRGEGGAQHSTTQHSTRQDGAAAYGLRTQAAARQHAADLGLGLLTIMAWASRGWSGVASVQQTLPSGIASGWIARMLNVLWSLPLTHGTAEPARCPALHHVMRHCYEGLPACNQTRTCTP